MDRRGAASRRVASKVLCTNKHRYFQRNQLKIRKLLYSIHAIFRLIMNTFIITEILLHCHRFFNMNFVSFFKHIFHQNDSLENVYSGLSLSLPPSLPPSLSPLCRYIQASALLWLMNETQVSFLTFVTCYNIYFCKLVCTKFKHRQSCSAPTDRRPDTRWVPKQNAEILHSIQKTSPPPSTGFNTTHTALYLSQ